MITSLRDFQAAPGVSGETSKEDFQVTLRKAGSTNTGGAQGGELASSGEKHDSTEHGPHNNKPPPSAC